MLNRAFYRVLPKDQPPSTPDRVLILSDVLDRLVAIHAYYAARGEMIGGITLNEDEQDRFEALVADAVRKVSFNVKLVATPDGVREYGREERL